MSSGSKCSKNGCTFFASKSGFCSQHDPAGEAERTQRREQDREQKIRFQAKEKRRLEEAREWWNAMRPRDSNSPKRYLLLGATPHEERRGRTHYNRPNVFLLGHDLPNRKGVNYRRYIEADYSSENADRLREIALNYEDQFDEISFDWSTMCAFFGGDNLDHRFQSFYMMLKDNGVFFLPEYNPVIDEALQRVGFQTRIVNVPDLGGDTIVNIAGIDKDSTTILVAIKKRVAAPAPRRGGTRKVKRKARATRRRNYK